MNYLKEIAGKNKIWICIYISLGIGLSFLSNYNISFFQKLIDKFTDGTLSLPVILVYGGFFCCCVWEITWMNIRCRSSIMAYIWI